MTISHVCYSFTIGGIESLILDLLREQSKTGKVSLVIVNKRYNKELFASIPKSVQVVLINRPEGNKWNPVYLLQLWMHLFKFKPTIIHCHNSNLIPVLYPFRKKCVYTVHHVNDPLTHLNKFRAVFAISHAVKRDLALRGFANSIVIYNGIDCKKFDKRQHYNFSKPATFNIVQVSRLSHGEKGQDLLIESAKQLVIKKGVQNIKFYLVGDGPSEQFLRQLITDNKLDDFVELLGPRERNWFYQNLHQFHLLVQPSRFEGFGLTLIEGICAGLPVIASNIDGPAEILENIPSASLFQNENVAEFVAQIVKVMAEYEHGTIHDKCQSSIEQISSKFSVTNTANNYLAHYAEVL